MVVSGSKERQGSRRKVRTVNITTHKMVRRQWVACEGRRKMECLLQDSDMPASRRANAGSVSEGATGFRRRRTESGLRRRERYIVRVRERSERRAGGLRRLERVRVCSVCKVGQEYRKTGRLFWGLFQDPLDNLLHCLWLSPRSEPAWPLAAKALETPKGARH
jgi:hypothetical protein